MTAANSSSISDGAAALVMMRRSTAEKRGLAPLAIVVGPRHARAGAGLVHHRAGRRDPEALRKNRLDRGQGRPLRDQRGLRRGDHGGDEGARPAARQGQRARRRLRARPSDRRLRRAHPGHADRRAAQARPEARRGEPVHRRRRGHRDGDRAALERQASCRSCSTSRSFLRPYGFRVVSGGRRQVHARAAAQAARSSAPAASSTARR